MGRMTSEGKIKEIIKKRLELHGVLPAHKSYLVEAEGVDPAGWYHMPVSIGMGTMGIPDFIGCIRGKFFAIEAKSDVSKKPTKLQQLSIDCINASGGSAYVVRSKEELDLFEVEVLLVEA